ncbi:hypothetical protein EJP80_12950 [Rahnella aquatilis]|nr:hypothetical protein EJP80_12950 [Rahnella aquatilis]
MQDAMYADELRSQLSYLRYKNLVGSEFVQHLMALIDRNSFSEATHLLDLAFTKHDINKNDIKDFKDNFTSNFKSKSFSSEVISDETSEQDDRESLIKKYFMKDKQNWESYEADSSNQLSLMKKDLLITRNQLNRFRNRYREEKFQLEKKNEELFELTKKHEAISSKYEKLTSELQQKRIEDKIPEYVSDVSKKLDDDDNLFMDKSQRWSRTGIILSLFATVIALYTFQTGIELLSPNPNLGYVALIFVFFRGFLAIGILSWVAYLCFNMSSSYIHESILRKDRQHALSFGRLFLQIYGDTATKDDAIEVFKDWNRSGDSAFSKKNSSPPNLLKIVDLFKKTESAVKDNE